MSDKKDIPDWQKQSATSDSEAAAIDLPAAQQEADDEARRRDLLEQARSFLTHDEIKDATTESKISFLEEKGLTNSEIQQLLGISRINTTNATSVMATSTQPDNESHSEITAQAIETPQKPAPIITYPEFLLHASKPPPLITPTRVLNAIYAGSVIGGTLYGVSRFILQPMFDSLGEARHDLFSSTQKELQTLEDRLESVVSKVPAKAKRPGVGGEGRAFADQEDSDDESSIASDPTEMFHRDIGVQTSPTDDLEPTEAMASKPSIAVTSEKLANLRGQLNVLLHSSSTALNATESAKTELKETETYLDQLRYGSGGTGYGALTGDDGWRSQIFGSKVTGANKKPDAIEEFKTDIRAMKGTLLSARNFPRGGERYAR